jgi:hypothetical protein
MSVAPAVGMIMHFVCSGIEHKVVDVDGQRAYLTCVNAGGDNDEYDDDDRMHMGAQLSLSIKEFIKWQDTGNFVIRYEDSLSDFEVHT